ncbi:hypothetical protein ACP70R_018848 [Stipagrostis hirtigluma subsp. patula]
MVSTVVTASAGVLSSLLPKLSTLLSDQYKKLKGVRKDIEYFCRELTDMNAVLEKLANKDKLDVQEKAWRNRVREMAYDIEDCIDIFMHNIHQGDDKDGLLKKTTRKIRKLRVRYQLANKLQELRAQVEEQSKSRERYKIDDSAAATTVVEVDPRVQALYEDEKRLVGIDGPQEEISQCLMEEADDDSGKLKVVSIVGYGGLGKTTLANQVYCRIKNKFDCKAFVSVSRNPDMRNILKGILSEVGYTKMEMLNDVQKLISTLREHLTHKRYLIIIDDIWSTVAWDFIWCSFVENNNGSRVITTTRNQEVARCCCSQSNGHVYSMQPLNQGDSRRLFFRRVFNADVGCPEQFRDISEDFLRKCKGVPLAINSIASLLATKGLDVQKWEKIQKSLGSELESNPSLNWMSHVLSLGYNDLSHELKTCLLYLGTYPEDYKIEKDELVQRWIAEGFVSEKGDLDLEEVADSNFNELINRSMIQPYDSRLSLQIEKCRVHDLMLDFIISKCTEENFITVTDRQYNMNGASQVRRISHQFNNSNMALAAERMSLSKVRSYHYLRTADCMAPLSKFETLRVLVLDKGNAMSADSEFIDLSAINRLFLLRYLKVKDFRLKLPKKFGKLHHLMTLDLAFVQFYPERNQSTDVTSLSSLRHLNLGCGNGVELRNGLSKLCNLRSLFDLNIDMNSVECIRDLGVLINLRMVSLNYQRKPSVEEHSEILKFDILAATLQKLLDSNLRSLTCPAAPSNSTQFWSNCFTRPCNLRAIRLYGPITQVPNWIVHAEKLTYLEHLWIQELRTDGLQILSQLPFLVYIYLSAETVPEKNIIVHPDTFPSLKKFRLICDELPCLTFEPGAMPQLQILDLCFDGRQRQGAVQVQEGSLVAGVEHLASLEKISLHIYAKYGHGSKLWSACKDAINRHPRSHTIQIRLDSRVV